MSIDPDMQDDPTQPRPRQASQPAVPSSPLPPPRRPAKLQMSRREFMGLSAIGLAGLGAAAGGAGLDQWWRHGGLGNLFHGPLASSMQTGHLLRRAGFGANPDDLTTYRSLG